MLNTRLLFKSASVFGFFSAISYAANVTNHIGGVGPDGSNKPYFCIQDSSGQVTLALAPDQSGDGNAASGNAYYVGGSLRFNGCNSSDTYLGFLSLSVNSSGNNAIGAYTAPTGVHVTYANPSIDPSGTLTGAIAFTPIDINSSLVHANPIIPTWKYAGINLSGLEFSTVVNPVVIPNLSTTDEGTSNSDLANTTAFIQEGINTIRVPVSWDYLQMSGAGIGTISTEYYTNFVRPLLATLTQAKVYTIVDMHAYMRYSIYGQQYSGCGNTGPCPDGTLVLDSAAYQSVWGQLLDLMQNDSAINMEYIVLDLMNEPVNVPDNKVFTIQTDLIKFLRDKKYNGPILVEGNSWAGLHSWTTDQWTGSDGTVYTNASLFTRENFNLVGIEDLSNIIINVHQYLDSDYSGTHSHCLTDLSTTGPNGFNLQAFVDYLRQNQLKAIVTEFGAGTDAGTCSETLNQFMQYLKDNAADDKDYGFVGWTTWSTGHGWGGSYNLLVTPTSYQMNILKTYLTPTTAEASPIATIATAFKNSRLKPLV